jgi:hypothetical protein
MEFFTILNHSDVFKKSFVENCKDIGSDLDDFNLSNFMKKISLEFESTFKEFIMDIKIGLKTRWKWLSVYLMCILIFMLWGIKMEHDMFKPLKIIMLLIIHIGLIIGRKFIWRFILIVSKNEKINTFDSIVKWIIQKIIHYYSSSVLRPYLFPNSTSTKYIKRLKNILPVNESILNIIHNILISGVGLSLMYLLYLKPLQENWSFDYVAKNYAGLSFLVGIIIMESIVTESLYVWNLDIKEGWMRYLIDFGLDNFVSYILMPIGYDISIK